MPRAGLTRDAVVAAALELVDAGGASGFERLTLAAVAERVGVAVPSLYKHVGGLDDLRRGVALEAVLTLRDVITHEAVGRAGPAALRAVARGIRSFATAHPGWYAAAQFAPAVKPAGRASGGGARPGGGTGRAADASRAADTGDAADPADPLSDAAASTVEALAAVLRGFELPDARTVDAVRLVRSAVHGFVVLEQGGGFGLPDDLDQSFDVVVEATVAGIGRLADGRLAG